MDNKKTNFKIDRILWKVWVFNLSKKISIVIMRKIRTHIKGLYIIKGKKFIDSRGWLREVIKQNYFK